MARKRISDAEIRYRHLRTMERHYDHPTRRHYTHKRRFGGDLLSGYFQSTWEFDMYCRRFIKHRAGRV